jgi:hydrogenase nickel incorporation protein HypB
MVRIEQDILGKNNAYADGNRKHFAEHGIFAVNLVSSPGSGKTTLLVKTIELLKDQARVAVVEGDQQTSNDADRIRATGAPAIQVNTGKGCHLDAHMVGHALERLALPDDSLLMIENVGNLVCPAAFDLGEAHKVVILSVTEGEDKPLKYPDMFHAADLMILNKVDLLPYLNFRRGQVRGIRSPGEPETGGDAGFGHQRAGHGWVAGLAAGRTRQGKGGQGSECGFAEEADCGVGSGVGG